MFMKNTLFAVVILTALAAVGLSLALSQFSLSAIPEPGSLETYLAAKATRFYIQRASRKQNLPPQSDLPASIEEGDKLYGTECGECHGLDGQTPTDAGRWMYPRAADLASRGVQEYSDRELFWIVQNGVCFTGMPSFGNVEPDERIWDLVRYLRTIKKSPSAR